MAVHWTYHDLGGISQFADADLLNYHELGEILPLADRKVHIRNGEEAMRAPVENLHSRYTMTFNKEILCIFADHNSSKMVQETAQLSVVDYVVFSLLLFISAAIGVYFGFSGGKQVRSPTIYSKLTIKYSNI